MSPPKKTNNMAADQDLANGRELQLWKSWITKLKSENLDLKFYAGYQVCLKKNNNNQTHEET